MLKIEQFEKSGHCDPQGKRMYTILRFRNPMTLGDCPGDDWDVQRARDTGDPIYEGSALHHAIFLSIR